MFTPSKLFFVFVYLLIHMKDTFYISFLNCTYMKRGSRQAIFSLLTMLSYCLLETLSKQPLIANLPWRPSCHLPSSQNKRNYRSNEENVECFSPNSHFYIWSPWIVAFLRQKFRRVPNRRSIAQARNWQKGFFWRSLSSSDMLRSVPELPADTTDQTLWAST